MNNFAYAAMLAAGTALALSPAPAVAQTEGKPISMGIRISGTPAGPAVALVMPGRTAEALGFKVGDVLVDAGGNPVSPQVLEAYMDGKKAGDALTFTVKRGDALIELKGKGLAAPEAAAPAR